eukprot:m.148750 g.148750  ORF g.148750 m.148750 type:complete len:943 (-) comp9723_c0_seq3:21-2849(-)
MTSASVAAGMSLCSLVSFLVVLVISSLDLGLQNSAGDAPQEARPFHCWLDHRHAHVLRLRLALGHHVASVASDICSNCCHRPRHRCICRYGSLASVDPAMANRGQCHPATGFTRAHLTDNLFVKRALVMIIFAATVCSAGALAVLRFGARFVEKPIVFGITHMIWMINLRLYAGHSCNGDRLGSECGLTLRGGGTKDEFKALLRESLSTLLGKPAREKVEGILDAIAALAVPSRLFPDNYSVYTLTVDILVAKELLEPIIAEQLLAPFGAIESQQSSKRRKPEWWEINQDGFSVPEDWSSGTSFSVSIPPVGMLEGLNKSHSIPFYCRAICSEVCREWDQWATSFQRKLTELSRLSFDEKVSRHHASHVSPVLGASFRAILGTPGSGKSLFLWAWGLRQCLHFSRKVLMFFPEAPPAQSSLPVPLLMASAVRLEPVGGAGTVQVSYVIGSLNLMELITDFVPDIVIIDGVKKSNVESMLIELKFFLESLLIDPNPERCKQCPRVIYGSSVNARPSRSFVDRLQCDVFPITWWPSWVMEDYLAAMQHPDLSKSFRALILHDQGCTDSALKEQLTRCDTAEDQLADSAAYPKTSTLDDASSDSDKLGHVAMDVERDSKDCRSAGATLEAVTWKYFYAGGSARHFFTAPLATIASDIADALSNLDLAGVQRAVEIDSPEGDDTVKHVLVQKFADNTCRSIVSQYAFQRIADKLANDNLITKYARVIYNAGVTVKDATIQGWGLDLMFHAKCLSLSRNPDEEPLRFQFRGSYTWGHRDVNGQSRYDMVPVDCKSRIVDIRFLRNSYSVFDPLLEMPEEYLQKIRSAQAGTHLWLHPRDWKQGCYDYVAIEFLPADAHPAVILWTLQVARSEVHSFQPKYLVELYQYFTRAGVSVASLTHCGFVLRRNFDIFQFSTPDSSEIREIFILDKTFMVTIGTVSSLDLDTD